MNPRMKSHHRDQLLQALMHYLPMDIRKTVMREVPAAYSDYFGGAPCLVVCYAISMTPVKGDDDA
jgi:hypothetical protein